VVQLLGGAHPFGHRVPVRAAVRLRQDTAFGPDGTAHATDTSAPIVCRIGVDHPVTAVTAGPDGAVDPGRLPAGAPTDGFPLRRL
jgi:hypothetical protein